MAQQTGVVWGGNNPDSSADFLQHHYSTPEDYTVVTPPLINPLTGVSHPQVLVPSVVVPATADPVGNHDLIASDSRQNWTALRTVLRELQQ